MTWICQEKALIYFRQITKILLILEDFNVEFNRTCMNAFFNFYFKISLKKPTLKNSKNPYIDLMLTNSPNNFKNSCAIETGLSDFHKITKLF